MTKVSVLTQLMYLKIYYFLKLLQNMELYYFLKF